MYTYVENNQTDLVIDLLTVKQIADTVISYEGHSYDEVSIYLVDMDQICSIHQDFFDDPSPTDCISFPMDEPDEEGYKILGDIFVCPKAAIDYAVMNGGDPYYETTLYTVHGLLHLLGYDDIEEVDQIEMREAEKRHMEHLKTLGLWLKDQGINKL